MRSKIAADKIAHQFNSDRRVPVTILRLGILYGPGANKVPWRGLMQLGKFRFIIGTGRNPLPYTYIKNAVDCILLAAASEKAVGKSYNVVDEPQVNFKNLLALTSNVLKERGRIIPVPYCLLMFVAMLMEARTRIRRSTMPPKLSRYVIKSSRRNMVYDTSRARRDLHWKSEVMMEQGLAHVAKILES
jgi:nucleoside-diphosphate-sugar epimerase